MPKTAKMMWNPREKAICSRAAVRLSSTIHLIFYVT